ncbi:Thiol:disulfide interchange protein DsbC precursor [compost metagenome]
MAFPRQGPGSPGYDALVNVWCASDRQTAMNQVKRGESLPMVQCDNPVSKQFALGDLIGIQGTPAIVLANGKMVPGYRPAAELTRLALAAE